MSLMEKMPAPQTMEKTLVRLAEAEAHANLPPPSQLPSLNKASLPAVYRNARESLAQCLEIDECKTWADKGAALASYAKQAQDEQFAKMAIRIRARAIRRCGQLLREIPAAKNQHDAKVAGGRGKAAKKAGLSHRQAKDAVRVARVSEAEFERQVESERPPTVKKLARQGTKPRGHAVVNLDAKRLVRAVDRFHDDLEGIDLAKAAGGLDAKDRVRLRRRSHRLGLAMRRIERLARKGRAEVPHRLPTAA